jgi:hypothetical protein
VRKWVVVVEGLLRFGRIIIFNMAKSENQKVYGRRREKEILDAFLRSPEAEFLAIYGRRRVGKTHLIREYCESRSRVFFSVTGQKDAPLHSQIFHFKQQIEQTFYGGKPLPNLLSWDTALSLMSDAVEDLVARGVSKPIILFFDELPWLATPHSRLIQALDHCWNTRLSRIPAVRLIVCGSAASWMLENLIQAKGGPHNRVTKRIRLEPFTLGETKEFLDARKAKFSPLQILELYMALGGVPHYLKQVEGGRSAAQNIGSICFDRNGILFDEFSILFSSLFGASEIHRKLIRAIAKTRQGILRDDLIRAVGMASGGRLQQRINEILDAGLITALTPYGHKGKYTAYRLIDEYAGFYLKWIEPAPKGVFAKGSAEYWITKTQNPGYRAWVGNTFEGICLKHARQIMKALGITGVLIDIGTWRYLPNKNDPTDRGAQVDLLFDRADGVINLCELKYSQDVFQVDKRYVGELKDKILVFEKKIHTKKDVFLTLVTTFGLKKNAWSEDLVQNVVTMDALFKQEGPDRIHR